MYRERMKGMKRHDLQDLVLIKSGHDLYRVYKHETSPSIIIVTHGSEDGYLMSGNGKMIPFSVAHKAIEKLYATGDNKVYIIACHEEARISLSARVDMCPLGSEGEMLVSTMELLDGPDLSGTIVDLTIHYLEA